MKKLIPDRREHGCDVCHKDVSTEVFLGYRYNVLWICGDCQKRITANIPKKHNQDIWTKKPYKKDHLESEKNGKD